MKLLKSLIMALLFMLSSCNNKDNYDSFLTEKTTRYNEQILSAIDHNESWTETPFLIVNKFFGPQYLTEGHASFAFEQTEISNDRVRIVVTQEGLLDDSVYGEKRIIEFVFKANHWVIDTIKLGFRCQANRGHQDYSGKLCI